MYLFNCLICIQFKLQLRINEINLDFKWKHLKLFYVKLHFYLKDNSKIVNSVIVIVTTLKEIAHIKIYNVFSAEQCWEMLICSTT